MPKIFAGKLCSEVTEGKTHLHRDFVMSNTGIHREIGQTFLRKFSPGKFSIEYPGRLAQMAGEPFWTAPVLGEDPEGFGKYRTTLWIGYGNGNKVYRLSLYTDQTVSEDEIAEADRQLLSAMDESINEVNGEHPEREGFTLTMFGYGKKESTPYAPEHQTVPAEQHK